MVLFPLLLLFLILRGSAPAATFNPTCTERSNVVFLVDTSNSTDEQDFKKELLYVQGLLDFFDVSPTTTRVAAISYSDDYEKKFGLNTHKTVDKVKEAVDKIKISESQDRNSHMAMKHAREILAAQGKGPNVGQPIIICFTTGSATDPDKVLKEAQKMQNKNIKLFVVHVGSEEEDTRLGDVAKVVTLPNEGDVSRQLNAIAAKICEGSETTEATTLEVTSPGITSPVVTTTEVTSPEVTSSVFTTPEVTSPVNTSVITTSEVTSPEVTSSEVTPSVVTSSEVTSPEVTPSVVTSSEVTSPEVTSPEVTTSVVTSPEVSSPVVTSHGVTSPVTTPPATSPPVVTTTTTKRPVVRCKRPADIVFLLDTSAYLRHIEFQLIKKFVQDMIGYFDVSPSATRVAVVSFSTTSKEEFGLGRYQSEDPMLKAVSNISFTDGGYTRGHKAIAHALTLLEPQPRDDAARIIIYVTASTSSPRDKTVKAAKKVRSKGILVFSVGIGHYVNAEELGQIATQNTTDFVHSVSTFPDLSRISESLGRQACKVPIPVVQPVPQCEQPFDLVFLVDTSGNIYDEEFPLLLEFVQDMIRQFDVSPQKTRVAVISYSKGTKEAFGLDKYQSSEPMLEAVGKIAFTNTGYLDSHDAIDDAYNLLSPKSRDDAVRAIIYIAHGGATKRDETFRIAEKVRNKGILMFTVGVGEHWTHKELDQIATENTAQFVHNVNYLEDLSALSETLGPEVCAAKAPIMEPVELCKHPVELVFLVDMSNSVNPSDFPFMMDFVIEVIELFDISPSTTRVAVVSFNEEHKEEFNLQKYSTVRELRKAVSQISFTGGGRTNPDLAIKHAREVILDDSRKDAGRVIISMIEGQPSDWSSTVQEADETRQEDIVMFAVGLGEEADEKKLEEIVFNGDEQYVYTAYNVTYLPEITKALGEKACSVSQLE
uniref:CREWS-A3 n=1 Tax=Colubraria reticulata TaxID=604273 RepID=A0AA96US83_9CAEN|nr:CREWS-A3 [Colubraria reticulata]